MLHRIGRRDIPWVVCDGLAPFREVGVAIIAGMGARTIAAILEAGPRPGALLLHAQDDPPLLRAYLANNGWRITQEALAPEARRYAEVIVAVPGHESSTGLTLHYGPRLLGEGDPHLLAHLKQLLRHSEDIAEATKTTDSMAYQRERERVDFLEIQLDYWTTRKKTQP
jgi:tRNA (adenine22-N1)-methyltransferase